MWCAAATSAYYSTMPCRLCLQPKPLRNSHIIPEFFYRPAYDEKGRLLAMRAEDRKPVFIQKGLREELLCHDCEQLLNDRYEKPVKTLWYDHVPVPDPLEADGYELHNIPYVPFKLLHLSILWRFAVASDPAFNQARLGPHEERLRRMVLQNDPGRPDEYQIYGMLLRMPETHAPNVGTFMPPLERRVDGRRVYLMAYGACVWHVVVAKHPLQDPLSEAVLTPQGRMFMPVTNITDFSPTYTFYSEHFARARQHGWGNSFERPGA